MRAARRLRRRDGRGVDILLTHAPPRDCGDREDQPHRGFECLHEVVAALQLRLLVHGHIHPYGQPVPYRLLGETAVVNVVGHLADPTSQLPADAASLALTGRCLIL